MWNLVINICPECSRGPKLLNRRHPETKIKICRLCYRKITGRIEIGICPTCNRQKQLYHEHPETHLRICQRCFRTVQEKNANTICPRCKNEKYLDRKDPITNKLVCRTCYHSLFVKKGRLTKVGTCPICHNPQLQLQNRIDGQNVCYNCYIKFLGTKKKIYPKGICPICHRGPIILCRRHKQTNQLICSRCGDIVSGKIIQCPLCLNSFYLSKKYSYFVDNIPICHQCFDERFDKRRLITYYISYYRFVLSSIIAQLEAQIA